MIVKTGRCVTPRKSIKKGGAMQTPFVKDEHSHSLCNILNCRLFRNGILAHTESFRECLSELTSIKLAYQYHLLKKIAF